MPDLGERPRLPYIPPETRREHHATAATMLAVEAALLQALRAAPTGVGGGDPVAVSRLLHDRVAAVVLAGRRAARKTSADRTAAELQHHAERLGIRIPPRPREPNEGLDVDRLRAEKAARYFIDGFLAAVMPKVGEEEPPSVDDAVGEALGRLDGIAATEVASAFGSERAAAYDDVPDAEAKLLAQVWDATLDARTCARCAALNGTIAPLDGSFPGGIVPGCVHPGDRCIAMTIEAPIRAMNQPKASAPKPQQALGGGTAAQERAISTAPLGE